MMPEQLPLDPTPTPEQGWPAQPALTAAGAFLKILREDVTTLLSVASDFEDPRRLRTPAVREELRRILAGVVGHCENLRLALSRKGGCG